MVATSTSENKHRQYLGTAIDAIPRDIHIVVESNCVPDGINQHDIQMFSTMYREHCEVGFSWFIYTYFSLFMKAVSLRECYVMILDMLLMLSLISH